MEDVRDDDVAPDRFDGRPQPAPEYGQVGYRRCDPHEGGQRRQSGSGETQRGNPARTVLERAPSVKRGNDRRRHSEFCAERTKRPERAHGDHASRALACIERFEIIKDQGEVAERERRRRGTQPNDQHHPRTRSRDALGSIRSRWPVNVGRGTAHARQLIQVASFWSAHLLVIFRWRVQKR